MTMASNRPPNIGSASLPPSSSASASSRRRQLRQFYVSDTTQHDTIGRARPSSDGSHRKAGRARPSLSEGSHRKAGTSRIPTRKTNKSAEGQKHQAPRPATSAAVASQPPSLSTDESFQAQRFDEVISADHIDMDALREVSWNGIPHQHRAQAWQHLLGYLPLNADRRAATLKRKRSEYRSYVEQHFESPSEDQQNSEQQREIHQIRVDIPRTSNLPFFKTDQVQRSLERMLITWSCRNLATGYVQGMNDLVAVLFLVFLKPHASDCGIDVLSEDGLFNVEADVYWCFTSLISQIQDHYTMDQPGVQRMISMVETVLQKVDVELWQHFQSQGVPIFHFTFKWINCLLSRELSGSAAARLWDTLLSEENSFELLLTNVCVALLHSLRAMLLEMGHDKLLCFLTQEELEMSTKEVEEILSQAYIWKMTVSTEPISEEEVGSKGAEVEEEYGKTREDAPSRESTSNRGNVLDNDEDILQAMMTSDYFLL